MFLARSILECYRNSLLLTMLTYRYLGRLTRDVSLLDPQPPFRLTFLSPRLDLNVAPCLPPLPSRLIPFLFYPSIL